MIHSTAEVDPRAQVGTGTKIWRNTHIREGAVVGENCIIGEHVYIDVDVRIGSRVKIQNAALVYTGATLEDAVFIGPRACLANDRLPRAINLDGSLKGRSDWTVGKTLLRFGASVGAGAIILPDVVIGRYALVAAGAVVTEDVPDHGLAVGIPARLVGWVCKCGARLVPKPAEAGGPSQWVCPRDGWSWKPDR